MIGLLAILAAGPAATAQWPVAHEVVRTREGIVISMTNTRVPFADMDGVLLVPGEAEEEPYISGGAPRGSWREDAATRRGEDYDTLVIAGPLSWGVVDGAFYGSGHSRGGGTPRHRNPADALSQTQVGAGASLIDLMIEKARDDRNRDWDPERSRVRMERQRAFVGAHSCACIPLIDYIKENAEALHSEWDLAFDLVYTAPTDVLVAAVRRGELLAWELDETGDIDAPWTARDPVPTGIMGAFRILRAGTDLQTLYFIDSEGTLYTGLGDRHRRIGDVPGFAGATDGALVLVFEDQQTQKIGFIHVTPTDTITVLRVDLDEDGFGADFYETLDDPDLRRHLVTMSRVLREAGED